MIKPLWEQIILYTINYAISPFSRTLRWFSPQIQFGHVLSNHVDPSDTGMLEDRLSEHVLQNSLLLQPCRTTDQALR